MPDCYDLSIWRFGGNIGSIMAAISLSIWYTMSDFGLPKTCPIVKVHETCAIVKLHKTCPIVKLHKTCPTVDLHKSCPIRSMLFVNVVFWRKIVNNCDILYPTLLELYSLVVLFFFCLILLLSYSFIVLFSICLVVLHQTPLLELFYHKNLSWQRY